MVGLVAFSNNSGLGAQTRRLAQLIKPDKILLIDSRPFSENKEYRPEWYVDFQVQVSRGFPNNEDVLAFLDGLTHVFTCENPFNFNLVYWAQKRGIKVYCQANYEFCENLAKPYLPIPDKFLMPSYWKIEDMQLHFGESRVEYLPPPIDPAEFEKARRINLFRKRKVRLLHIIGTTAHLDRNGTLDLLKAIPLAKSKFELVIRTQHLLPENYRLDDPRVTYDLGSYDTNAELYENFDALILPRRYGGLSLTTNEALMAGIPVFMPNISPNNKLLPPEWLIPAKRIDFFRSRSLIAVYETDPQKLADKIDWFVHLDKPGKAYMKGKAYGLARGCFANDVLQEKYEALFKSV